MFETIGFICLLAILGVLLAKIYNISLLGEAYNNALIFIGLIVALFSWVFYYIILSGSIMQTATITGTTETFTLATTEFYYLSMLLPVANFLLIIVGFLTLVEGLMLFKQLKTRPQGLRGK